MFLSESFGLFFFALGYISRPEVLGLKKYMSSKDLDIY